MSTVDLMPLNTYVQQHKCTLLILGPKIKPFEKNNMLLTRCKTIADTDCFIKNLRRADTNCEFGPES